MKSVAFAIAPLLVGGLLLSTTAQRSATPATQTDPMTTGSVGSYGLLISSFSAGRMADVATIGSTSTVSCVKISTLEDVSVDATELDNALAKNAAQLGSLKLAVSENADLKARLEASACPINQVVAVTTGADRSFIVYIDDRPGGPRPH